MAHSTRSAAFDQSPETPLETGLAALKAKDYQGAIHALQPIVETQPQTALGIRAAMGLVVAYEQMGQPTPAIVLCRTLAQNSHPQVKAWAGKTLVKLLKRYPPQPNFLTREEPKTIDPGFVPLVETPAPAPATGFVSLSPPASPPPIPQTTAVTPEPAATESTSTEPTPPPPQQWRQAGRLNGGRRVPGTSLPQFWVEQGITLIAFLWLIYEAVRFSLININHWLVKFPWTRPNQLFYQQPTAAILITAVVFLLLSPWLLDGFFTLFYGLKNFPLSQLLKKCPEAHKTVRQICQKRGWQNPSLKILPLEVPVIFTYGCWPRFARIVISQGLLTELSEDEIAALYAQQMGHIVHGDFILMSLISLVLLVPYTIYWQLTEKMEWLSAQSRRLPNWVPEFVTSGLPYLVTGIRGIVAVIAALSYGYFWLLQWPLFWISRRRVYLSDRFACEITGNPNGLARALVKLTIGMATDVQTQGQTRPLWESCQFLLPISVSQALAVGSGINDQALTSLLAWDCTNPDRQWLVLNQTHPVLGDRLQRLAKIATSWKLEPEFDLPAPAPAPPLLSRHWRPLLLQGAPFFGLPLGLAVAGILWALGAVFGWLGILELDWLWADVGILQGCLFLGFGLGMLLRINHFFPDIKPKKAAGNAELLSLLSDPQRLPLNSRAVHLEGQLLGRVGLANGLGQDLVLKTPTGLLKLRDCGRLGPISLLWSPALRARSLVGQQVSLIGWWRRGATPWVDLEIIRGAQGKTGRGYHPIWSTLVAFATAIWGAYIISQGGL